MMELKVALMAVARWARLWRAGSQVSGHWLMSLM